MEAFVITSRANYRLIKEAHASIRKGKYIEAAISLEKALSSGQKDPYTLFLLTLAYLYTEQYGKAESVMSKIKTLSPGYPPVIHLQAFLGLKSAGSFEVALKLYLDLMSRYPNDPQLRHSRRELGDTSRFDEFQKNARLADFVQIPKPGNALKKQFTDGVLDARGRPIPPGRPTLISRPGFLRRAALFFFGAAAACGLAGAVYLASTRVRTQEPLSGRNFAKVDLISLGGGDYDLILKINRDKPPVFYSSAKDMTGDFNEARRLIKSEKYNQALLLLNRIMNSNASFIVKEKVDFLIGFVMEAEERRYEPVSLETVMREPYLYKGFAVKWRGRIANLRRAREKLMFTLLVDFRGKGTFSGVADVFIEKDPGGLSSDNDAEIEAVITSLIGEKKSLYLVAHSVKKI